MSPKSKSIGKRQAQKVSPGDDYRKWPALAAYIDRIGAEQRNFRRFVFKEQMPEDEGHYFREHVINVGDDGQVTVKNEVLAPTEPEAAAIAAELHQREFPKSITTTIADADAQRRKLGISEDDWFVMLNRARTDVAMCQQRVQREDGKKNYFPWTKFSDNNWRRMEPSGDLPLWKPKEKRRLRIMLHEGAKAARFCDWLVHSDDEEARRQLRDHPWADDLRAYDHWGWPGGAPNPFRVDWLELIDSKPTEVVLVCDNDAPSKRAAGWIARALKGINLAVLMFDDQFAEGFDLADDWPEKFYKTVGDRKVFAGNHMTDYIRPAIWATELKPTEKGKPQFWLRAQFREQWACATKPPVFVARSNRRSLYNAEEFNTDVRPFSDVKDTAALLRRELESAANSLAYQPGIDGFFVNVDGQRCINTWMKTSILPKTGDVARWLEFMNHLITDPKDRDHLLRWCATLIARPDIRMHYGVLLISRTQGVGKGTLMEKILLPLVGAHNCSVPSEDAVTNNQFNYWQVRRRLVLIHEIYAGRNKRAYDRIKSAMTDKFIDVNEKNRPQYQIENWVHIIASSNSPRALHMVEEDRRWLIPRVTSQTRPKQYWIEFNDWLIAGGLEAIHQWAKDYVVQVEAVRPGELPPMSATKAEMIEASRSPAELRVRAVGETVREIKEETLITDRGVREWLSCELELKLNDRTLPSFADIRAWLIDAGLRLMRRPDGNPYKKAKGERSEALVNYEGVEFANPSSVTDLMKLAPGDVDM